MSKRMIDTGFWNDEEVVETFTVDDRYFWLYLMTNPKINIAGVMPFSRTIIGRDLGYDKNVINSLLNRFQYVLGKIIVDEDTKELLFIDWHKYNWTVSPKLATALVKETDEVKSPVIRHALAKTISKIFSDTVSIPYLYRILKEKENEKVIESAPPTPPLQRLPKEEKEEEYIYCRFRGENLETDEQLERHTTTMSMSSNVNPTQQNQSTDGTVADSDTGVEKCDGEIKVLLSPQAQEIYDLWREIGPIKPRVPSEAIVKACKAALSKFSIKDITEAITHYVAAYNDSKYFFKYKWDLPTFLKQRNCIPNFMEGGVAWENYKARVEKRDGKQAPQKVFVEFEQDNKQESKYE